MPYPKSITFIISCLIYFVLLFRHASMKLLLIQDSSIPIRLIVIFQWTHCHIHLICFYGMPVSFLLSLHHLAHPEGLQGWHRQFVQNRSQTIYRLKTNEDFSVSLLSVLVSLVYLTFIPVISSNTFASKFGRALSNSISFLSALS